MSDEPKLTPASRADLAQTLAHALRYNGRKRWAGADDYMAQIAAEHLIAHLDRCGYVVMKKPAIPAHAAPYSPPE